MDDATDPLKLSRQDWPRRRLHVKQQKFGLWVHSMIRVAWKIMFMNVFIKCS